MAKKKKYLEFYEKCMVTGELPNRKGLCNEFGYRYGSDEKENPDLNVFYPPAGEYTTYWGFGLDLIGNNTHKESIAFTPLRQTIVLFMAAMNGEL